MRLYHKRLIKTEVKKQQDLRVETRDAVVYDIDTVHKIARVKIQGSDTLIYAWYPENWENAPTWLKPGNAVRIMHTGGSRSRVELVGHGQIIPTYTPGGIGGPEIPPEIDHIRYGCELKASDIGSGLNVIVNRGSVMIDQETVLLGNVTMDALSSYTMGDGGYMGGTASVLQLEPASDTTFRFDRIAVGLDGVPYVISGSGFSPYTTTPFVPGIDVHAISLGFVLIYPNMQVVTQADINKDFNMPTATSIKVIKQQNRIEHGQSSLDFSVGVVDQYGNYLDPNYITGVLAWYWINYKFHFLAGNGTFAFAQPLHTGSTYIGSIQNVSGEDFSIAHGGFATNPPLYMRFYKDSSSAIVQVSCDLAPSLITVIDFISKTEDGYIEAEQPDDW